MDNDPTSTQAVLLPDDRIFEATRRCIEAWNSLDLDAILATYSEDVVYQDSGSNGRTVGRPALAAYLKRFLAVWDMQFTVTEDRRIAGADAQVCLWDVVVRRRGGASAAITTSGIDIIHVNGAGELTRDEAYLDRVPLLDLRGA